MLTSLPLGDSKAIKNTATNAYTFRKPKHNFRELATDFSQVSHMQGRAHAKMCISLTARWLHKGNSKSHHTMLFNAAKWPCSDVARRRCVWACAFVVGATKTGLSKSQLPFTDINHLKTDNLQSLKNGQSVFFVCLFVCVEQHLCLSGVDTPTNWWNSRGPFFFFFFFCKRLGI